MSYISVAQYAAQYGISERTARLLMFWQCLQNNIVPFIITEDLRLYYHRGIQNWNHINGFLTDTCLTAQDYYKEHLQYFSIKF